MDSPLKGPVGFSFDGFFDISLNKLLNKQSCCCWFKTPSSCDFILILWQSYFSSFHYGSGMNSVVLFWWISSSVGQHSQVIQPIPSNSADQQQRAVLLVIQTSLKNCCVVIQNMMKRNLQNLTVVMRVVLVLYLANYIFMWWPGLELQLNVISSIWEFRVKCLSEMRPWPENWLNHLQCTGCKWLYPMQWNSFQFSCLFYIWGLWCQTQVSQTGISNCIPQYSVGCNYLTLPEISASGNKVLIYSVKFFFENVIIIIIVWICCNWYVSIWPCAIVKAVPNQYLKVKARGACNIAIELWKTVMFILFDIDPFTLKGSIIKGVYFLLLNYKYDLKLHQIWKGKQKVWISCMCLRVRKAHMMTSLHGNTFSITGPLWGIPHTKGQWCGALMMFPLMAAWTN